MVIFCFFVENGYSELQSFSNTLKMALKWGRPPKFENPEELQKLIDAYFASTEIEEYTITGLCIACGTTRNTMMEYEEKPEYRKMIQHAKSYIENSYEHSLKQNGRSGDIFALKNFGWRDQIETKNTTVTTAVDPETLS